MLVPAPHDLKEMRRPWNRRCGANVHTVSARCIQRRRQATHDMTRPSAEGANRMDEKITRKRFLLSLFGSTAAVLLDGCGGGGGGYSSPAPMTPPPPPPPSIASCGASGSAIAGNHGHVLNFVKTDTDPPTSDKTYDIMGTADHTHSVTLTAAQLDMLHSGSSVIVTSTVAFGHQHDVTVSC